MPLTHPVHIATPGISAYPYIRLLYENIDCHMPKEPLNWDRVGPHVIQDDEFNYSKQHVPSKIDNALMAPLAAMSDDTFEALCSALRLRAFGEPITSRSSLADLTQRHFNALTGADHTASLDQVMTHLFLNARISRHIEWAHLAELYNRSSDDQQEALHRYFTDCLNRDLGFLFRIKAPQFDLPAAFDKPLQARIENGEKQLFDVAAGKWLREAVVMHQFEVNAIDSHNRDILIATAPTLELAIARGITGVIDFKGKLFSASIAQNGRFVASGNIEFTSGDHPRIKDKDPRVTWIHSDQRPSKNEGGFTKADFTKTLYDTEAAMGMQWSKVAKLEDELGL
jgi:hypothetical protein